MLRNKVLVMLRSRRLCRLLAFTLVEVMVALLVITVACLAFLPLFIQGEQAVRTAHHREIATLAAHQALEGWRQMGFALLPTIPIGQTTVDATFTPPAALPGATGTVTFTRVDTGFAPSAVETGRRKMAAHIAWQGVGPDVGVVNQTTLIVNQS